MTQTTFFYVWVSFFFTRPGQVFFFLPMWVKFFFFFLLCVGQVFFFLPLSGSSFFFYKNFLLPPLKSNGASLIVPHPRGRWQWNNVRPRWDGIQGRPYICEPHPLQKKKKKKKKNRGKLYTNQSSNKTKRKKFGFCWFSIFNNFLNIFLKPMHSK